MAPGAFFSCPVPLGGYEHVVLGHGGGGRLMNDLVTKLFMPAFRSDTLAKLEDAATVSVGEHMNIAVTTDSFVVHPIFFRGGDIGRLAICGTVNDLAVSGAEPKFLSAAFILEEGLPLADLARIAASMQSACEEAAVELVAGDTKVVERGKGDQIFITTTGVGVVPPGRALSIANVRPGDAIVVSGTLGDHGVAILSAREGIAFETELASDCAPLSSLARAVLEAAPRVRCMRDPTRGGLASALGEIASASRVGFAVNESSLPLRDEVRGACELLGLDPLYIASEGKLVAVVAREDTECVLGAMRAHPLGREATVIGSAVADHAGIVTLRSLLGSTRIVPVLAGEQLPRIC